MRAIFIRCGNAVVEGRYRGALAGLFSALLSRRGNRINQQDREPGDIVKVRSDYDGTLGHRYHSRMGDFRAEVSVIRGREREPPVNW